jgi:hypothetical protein
VAAWSDPHSSLTTCWSLRWKSGLMLGVIMEGIARRMFEFKLFTCCSTIIAEHVIIIA